MTDNSGKDTVRFGIVGIGGIAQTHARSISQIPEARLAAVCDIAQERAEAMARDTDAKVFTDYREMIDSGELDAVVVATPHSAHPEISIYALEKGLHVLSEKPLAEQVNAARKLAEAAQRSSAKFAINFQMRTFPVYQRTKQILASGELGNLHRVMWQATRMFRSQAYFNSVNWRGTWAGEGGGVLLNQYPHHLDLFQWFFGMPRRVTAFVQFGKYHDIETEDDATAFLEFDDGKTAVLITATGDHPGTDRLDVAGDRGKLVLEDNRIAIDKLPCALAEFSRTTDVKFGGPAPAEHLQYSFPEKSGAYEKLFRNFVDAILHDTPLLSPGEVGLNSLELANAILLSAARQETITLPLDGDAYENFLREKITAAGEG